MLNDPFDLSDEMKDLSEIQKIAVVQWAMKHIVDHANGGGSYRHLIYTRLGFSMEAYAPLCKDGLTISNELSFETKEIALSIVNAVIKDKEGDLDLVKTRVEELKKELFLCDAIGCTEETSSIWHTEAGSRQTCYKHYKGRLKS
jgi:hypothetical protein